MSIAVILPAAGSSQRFRSAAAPLSKLDVELAGHTVLHRTINLFRTHPDVAVLIVVGPHDPDAFEAFAVRHADALGMTDTGPLIAVCRGGETRAHSVTAALAYLATLQLDAVSHVAIHDAARPLTPPALINTLFHAALKNKSDAIIPGIPVSDTVKRLASSPQNDSPRTIETTVDRSPLALAQTPQVFARDLITRAYDGASADPTRLAALTDDASAVEQLGHPVQLIPGDPTNIKITHPRDLALAHALLNASDSTPG